MQLSIFNEFKAFNEDVREIFFLFLAFLLGCMLFRPSSTFGHKASRRSGSACADKLKSTLDESACHEVDEYVGFGSPCSWEVSDSAEDNAIEAHNSPSQEADAMLASMLELFEGLCEQEPCANSSQFADRPIGNSCIDDAWTSCSTASNVLLQKPPTDDVELARSYGRRGRPDLAVDLWHERANLIASTEALPVPSLYSAALEACVESRDFISAARLARSAGWQAPSTCAGQSALLSLARWLSRRKDMVSAEKCVAAVREKGGIVGLPTCRALLVAATRSADMALAAQFFQNFIDSGLEPDVVMFSAMVRGSCSVGNVDQAMAYMQAMKEHGLKVDAPLFDALLCACARVGMLAASNRVLTEMSKQGVRPSNSNIASLVRLHGTRGELGRAKAIFEEMPALYGLERDTQVYGAFVQACSNNGRVDKALEVFDKMVQAGCQVSARTYEVLITGCLRHGDLDRAISLVDDALGLASQLEIPIDVDDVSTMSSTSGRRAVLDKRVVEELFRLLGRRRQAQRLGAPLLKRLRSAGFDVPDIVVECVLRSAASCATAKPKLQDLRREELRHWRSFPLH